MNKFLFEWAKADFHLSISSDPSDFCNRVFNLCMRIDLKVEKSGDRSKCVDRSKS